MPGKSKKGGGLKSSPVYKKQKYGTPKSPFRMKGSPYKQGNREAHLQTGEAYNPNFGRPTMGTNQGFGQLNMGMGLAARMHRPVNVDYGGSARNIKGRKFDMDRWIA